MVCTTLLRYAKKKRKNNKVISSITQDVKATDMLYLKMTTYNTKAKDILQNLINITKSSDKADYARIKPLLQMMRSYDDIVIDCAHKLAPYQTPKLESVELRQKVEHRFVMQVPTPIKSAEDWMKITGAKQLEKKEETVTKAKRELVPSIHDYDEDQDDEDSYVEPGMLN